MSYRTYVNDTQIFGNNECYPEWIVYIKSKDIEVGENDSYTGELDNFMEALDVIESIVMKLEAERRENKKMAYLFIPRVYLTLAKFTTQSLQIRTRRVCWIVKLNIYKMPTCSCRMPS